MSHLRAEFERPEDRDSVAALTEAMLAFGVCELRMRRSERLKVVGVHTAEAKELAASALAENKRGLAALPSARPLIKRFAGEETGEDVLASWREASSQLRQEWREQVADLDIEAVKARQLIQMADEVCDAADKGGLAGLGQHLTERLAELGKVRRSKSRGTEAESFPYWKIVAAAIAWGFGVGVMILLITRRAGPLAMFGWWFVIAVITFCIAIGC
jgi:hypothetical protein